ncbi:MAG: T9SS type B sorting domain-containing protein [Ferruginibacter sp.]
MRLRYLYLLFPVCVSLSLRAQPPCPGAIAVFPYQEGFELSNGNWVPGGTASDWAWGTPAKPLINAAGQGIKCWITGGLNNSSYNPDENSYLVSPCFDFTSLINPRVSFKIFWETEKKFDGASFQYSTNGGTVWNLLGSVNSNASCLGVNWFNSVNITYLAGLPGWSGNIQTAGGSCASGNGNGSGGWLTASHDLTPLAGQSNVQFRFLFGAGTICNSYDGFAIDDVNIFEAPPNTASFISLCKPARTIDFTATSPCTTGSSWDFGDPASGANNFSTAANPSHTFSTAGSYTVKLTSTFASGPSSMLPRTITVLDITANIDQAITCNGSANAMLSAVAAGSTNPYTYTWNTNPVQTGPGITAGPGTYTVTVTSGMACPATSIPLTVTEPSALQASPVVTDQKCTLGMGSIFSNISGGTPPYQYQWSTGAMTANLLNIPAGTYSLIATDSKGCTFNSGNINVAFDAGDLKVDLGKDAQICPGQKLILNPGIFDTYLWQDNSTLSTFPVTVTGGYTVTVTDVNGCTGKDSIYVLVDCSAIYFPTAFTPNGDTKNEKFGPAGNNLSVVKNYRLDIYNRYGELIFNSIDPFRKWDGKINGLMQGNQSFVWTASYTINGKQEVKKGVMTLIK